MLQMRERRVLVRAFAGQYGKASKSEKGRILDRFVKATNYLWGPECGSLRLRIPSAGLVTSRFYNFVIAIEFKVLEHRCLSAGPTNLNPERRFPVGHAKENARVIL